MKKLLSFRINIVRLIAVILMLGVASTSWAAPTVYTTEADFTAVLQSPCYLEDFNEFTYGSFTGYSLDFGPVNGYSYTMSAENKLYSGNGNMSTNASYDALVTTFTGAPVTAVGGLFWPTNYYGGNIVGDITLELVDGGTYTYTLDDASSTTFTGFTNATPFVSISITAPDSGEWPTVDHLYVGQVVPIPGAVLLLGSGLLGLFGLRRKFSQRA